MPFVTDSYSSSAKMEAVAALGMAVNARKSRGFPGRRKQEEVQALVRISLPLQAATWQSGEGGCTGLVVDPQGLLTGKVEFELPASDPGMEMQQNPGEEEFLSFCQKIADFARDFSPETLEVTGLITRPEEAAPLLKEDDQERQTVTSWLEQTVSTEEVLELLQQKISDYHNSAQAWTNLKQEALAYRDHLAGKIKQEAAEAREASDRALDELKQQVGSAIAARRQEIENSRENAHQEHQRQKELLQAELERFQKEFKETGEEIWRDKIKAEEKRMADNDRKLKDTLARLDDDERKFNRHQEERINKFHSEREKRLEAYEQRLKRLDTAVAEVEKAVDHRVDSCRRQNQKVADLVVTLPEEHCEKSFPVIFYAALFSGDRWQVFPPQEFSTRGIKGRVTRLMGLINLPFRPSSQLGEILAEKIQELIPGHVMEAGLLENNLLNDPGFVEEARAGLSLFIDQGALEKKHSGMFEGF